MIGGYGAHCNTGSLRFNHVNGVFEVRPQSRCPRLPCFVFVHGTEEALPPS